MERNDDLILVEENLIKEIERLSFIVDGLNNYEPYKALIKHFEEAVAECDGVWHLETSPDGLRELRITKMAAQAIIDKLPSLNAELDQFKEELAKLQNPEEHINKDYDGE